MKVFIYSARSNFLTHIIGLFVSGWAVYVCRSFYNWKFHKKILHCPQFCHKHYTELANRVLCYANKMQSQVRASDCNIQNTELVTAQCFHKNTSNVKFFKLRVMSYCLESERYNLYFRNTKLIYIVAWNWLPSLQRTHRVRITKGYWLM